MATDERGGGWFSYAPGHTNPHLTEEQRELVERADEGNARRRGVLLARVTVDVYSSGETVPQVQTLQDGIVDSQDEVRKIVERAAATLTGWR